MVDREKVIKGLECCAGNGRGKECIYKEPVKDCPYEDLCGEYEEDLYYDCTTALAADALELLKDQESLKDDKKELKWFARIRSDYSPDTFLLISRSEDGDVSIKIIGDDEMRIATSGGHLHGDALVRVIDAFQTLINVINCCEIVRYEGYTDQSGLMPAT